MKKTIALSSMVLLFAAPAFAGPKLQFPKAIDNARYSSSPIIVKNGKATYELERVAVDHLLVTDGSKPLRRIRSAGVEANSASYLVQRMDRYITFQRQNSAGIDRVNFLLPSEIPGRILDSDTLPGRDLYVRVLSDDGKVVDYTFRNSSGKNWENSRYDSKPISVERVTSSSLEPYRVPEIRVPVQIKAGDTDFGASDTIQ